MMEKMKTTAPVSSVGADGVQPNVKNHNEIIAKTQRNPVMADCIPCPCRNCMILFLCREYRL